MKIWQYVLLIVGKSFNYVTLCYFNYFEGISHLTQLLDSGIKE